MKTRFWVEKTPGNEFRVKKYLKRYPKAKFIHVIRDPLSSISSIKRLYNYKNRKFVSWERALYIRKSFKTAIKNQKKCGNNKYFIVRYEDLVSDTKNTIVSLSSGWKEISVVMYDKSGLIISISTIHVLVPANHIYLILTIALVGIAFGGLVLYKKYTKKNRNRIFISKEHLKGGDN